MCLCPCCFCKLLGFVFMRICRLLWFVPCYVAFMFCCLILLAKCYAYTLCIVYWLSVGHASDLQWAYWLVCLDVNSKCEWELWSLFYSDCLFGQAMVYYLIPFLLDRIVLTLYALQVFPSYNDHIVLLCFRRFLFICFKSSLDSRVRCEWVLFNYSQLTC